MNTHALTQDYAFSAGREYYDGPELVDTVRTALWEAGLDGDHLDIDDLAPLDEFHALGRAATIALAELAAVRASDDVLDVGAGIGGPARFLAHHYGAHVTAVDPTPRFRAVAELLTRGSGLADRVRIVHGDGRALPFDSGTFDLVWTQAVGQNIAEKAAFVAEMTRVLRRGGRLAMFELLAGPGGPVEFPVPWANRQEESHLLTGPELRTLLESAGLEITTWNEGPDALASIGAAAATLPPPPPDPQLGLHMLMPDFEARMQGVARNIAQEKIVLVQVVARTVPFE